jgi:hydrogenase maturation protease
VSSEADPRRPMVIGVGTEDRSDDGAGLEVVRALRGRAALDAEIVEGPGDLTGLLELWEGRSLVILVDATRSRAAGGTIRRWQGEDALAQLPLRSSLSSHGLSLSEVLRLGRELDRFPQRMVIYGIEAQETGPGSLRSETVSAAIPLACDRIAREIAEERTQHA